MPRLYKYEARYHERQVEQCKQLAAEIAARFCIEGDKF